MPSDTRSPTWSHRGGFWPRPTPGGVPVVTTSPGCRIGQDEGRTEDHGPGRSVLEPLAVDLQPHGKVVHVAQFVRRHQPGPERTEAVAALALVPLRRLHLESALGDVVADAIAGDRLGGLGLRDIGAVGADHEGQFDFPVQLGRTARLEDRIVRARQRAGGLHEHHWLFRNGQARLGGVVGVVQADADELARLGHAGPQAGVGRRGGQRRRIQAAQRGQAVKCQGRRIQVADHPAQVADNPVVVDQARPFLAGGSKAQQLHRKSPKVVRITSPSRRR
jgi:hypothetical protein